MVFDKREWRNDIEKRIKRDYFKTLNEASVNQLQYAFSRQVLGQLWDNWSETTQKWENNKLKMAYYFSAEFLMGRWLGNTMINMGTEAEAREAVKEMGIDYNALEEAEADAGLGNGGLGRLAACFLDSLATLNMPAMGYGIRYKYGMFEQKIVNNEQIELPDNWLANGDPSSIARPDEKVTVKFGGHTEIHKQNNGHDVYCLVDTEDVIATPYDLPVAGYNTSTVVTLRLWEASSADGFDLNLFQNEEYTQAVTKQNRAEDISRVLYPNDRGAQGKTLRLRQQFFFVSASIQDIINRYKRVWGNDLSHLNEAIAIQMNDTHPVIAIAELMRILLDEEGFNWEAAWELTIRCCAYTNHTIMAEALEKWPIDIFQALLPRHYQIIEEINRRFLSFLRQLFPGDWDRHAHMSIIADGVVRMAWLAIVGSHSVNGVAALHTELLKTNILKDWYEVFPEKFNNKTNGVTQRRWLLKANPQLAALITEKIGADWITDMSKLDQLKKFADDDTVIQRFMDIKKSNKERLAAYIKEHNHVEVSTDSIFDVQVKRLHEYKRQLLAALHIMWLYKKIKTDPSFNLYPRTFIFGAKSASGYKQAKLIIHLLNNIADVVNNDPAISSKIKVIFLENYRVSLAEKIFPASDVSEQISTAGYEASGTGNMKFMMNGALTLGTMDGANIEIVEAVGKDNAFIFGLTAEEVLSLKAHYHPDEILSKNNELNDVLNMMLQEPFTKAGTDLFKPLYTSLVHGLEGNPADQYFVLKDFDAYVRSQQAIDELYSEPKAWAKKAFLNVASSGKFSSDRTILEYANDIWQIKPLAK